MSSSVNSTTGPLTLQTFKDPSITFGGANGTIMTRIGPKVSNYTRYPSTAYSNSSVTHTVTAPSKNTALSRRIYLEHTWRLKFTGTPGLSGKRINVGFDGPRAFPSYHAMTNIRLQLNNQSSTMNPRRVIAALMQFGLSDMDQLVTSMTPSMQDQLQNYDDAWNYNLCPDLVGPHKNVLGSYGDSKNGKVAPRGAFPYTVDDSNPAYTLVTFTTLEPLIVSPCDANPVGLPFGQLNNLVINYEFDSSLFPRLWSHNDLNPIANGTTPSDIQMVEASLVGAPVLHVHFSTLPDTANIPQTLTYPFYPLQDVQTDYAVDVDPGQQYTITSNSFQLNTIPSRLLCWVELQDSYKTMSTCDTFQRIDQIALSWDNYPAINTNAQKEDNWLQNFLEGQNDNFVEFIKTKGNVFVFTPASNFPMVNPEDAPGVTVQRSIQITAVVTNIDRNTYTPKRRYKLMMLFIGQGKFDIQDGESMVANSLLVQQDILNAQSSGAPRVLPLESEGDAFKDITGKGLYGGSAWSGFKKGLSAVGRIAAPIAKEAGTVALRGTMNAIAAQAGLPPAYGRGLPNWSIRGGAAVSKQVLAKRARESPDEDQQDLQDYNRHEFEEEDEDY